LELLGHDKFLYLGWRDDAMLHTILSKRHGQLSHQLLTVRDDCYCTLMLIDQFAN
jgi:hypothetical protein